MSSAKPSSTAFVASIHVSASIRRDNFALDIPHNEVAPETDGNLVWAQCETNSASVTLNPTGEDEPGVVPDVRGYGLRDALFRLERLGLKVEVKGKGRVSSQSRKPGEKFERGQTILLLLGNVEDIPKAERSDTLKADTTKVAKKREEPEDCHFNGVEKGNKISAATNVNFTGLFINGEEIASPEL